MHHYFIGDSAPFRIERDFRTMLSVFYGDFVPMGYVCIVFYETAKLWGYGAIKLHSYLVGDSAPLLLGGATLLVRSKVLAMFIAQYGSGQFSLYEYRNSMGVVCSDN